MSFLLRPVLRAAGTVGLGAMIAAAPIVSPRGAFAQQAPAEPSAQEALGEPLTVSPGGAFLRAVLVPGWGHVAIGSHTRGGFYFALEAATAYTFLRTQQRLSEARERASLRESVVRTTLAEQGVTDPMEVQAALDGDETLSGFRDLIESRESQREDLVAWGIFVLFLAGADAYVSAHLARFPEPIEVQLSPVASDRAEVALRIPLPNFP